MLVAKYNKIREKMEERGQRKTPSLQNKKYVERNSFKQHLFLILPLSSSFALLASFAPWRGKQPRNRAEGAGEESESKALNYGLHF